MSAAEYLQQHPAEALRDVAEKLYPDSYNINIKKYKIKGLRVEVTEHIYSRFFEFNPLTNPAQRLELQDAYRKDLRAQFESKGFTKIDPERWENVYNRMIGKSTESATTQLIAYMELHGIAGDENKL